MIKRDIKIFAMAGIIGLTLTALNAHANAQASQSAQERIAEQIIRFHVLANSDSDNDQEVKMLVKENVLQALESEFKNVVNIDETREVLVENLSLVEETARETIMEQGLDFEVKARLVNKNFPRTTYNNMVLPSGAYEALQIVIGEGTGQNWWCVMFPMLCFVESAHGSATDEMQFLMRNILSPSEYDEIFEVRFRSLNWLRNNNENNEPIIGWSLGERP